MKPIWAATFVITFAMAAALLADGPPRGGAAKLRTVNTPHYIIHTDVDEDMAREAAIRMTHMFEEYQRRTAGFSGEINGQLPFYFFRNAEDYYAAGGPPGSGGVFLPGGIGGRLMSIAGKKASVWTWHAVQHEGFHQFVDSVIRGDIPTWIDEGLAEYFGEALFTGDSFVSGVIPPDRLHDVQLEITQKKLLPFKKMMMLTRREWNKQMEGANYDQAWAMIHFLAQGEDGKYQKPFVNLMKLISAGKPYLDAWFEVFGRDVDAFEKRFEKWWLDQPKDPTRLAYDKSTLLTLTSFLARAHAQGQTFDSFAEYIKSAKADRLKCSREDFLPPALLTEALKEAAKLDGTKLVGSRGDLPKLVWMAHDRTQLTTSFTLNSGRVNTVSIEVKLADTVPPTLPKK